MAYLLTLIENFFLTITFSTFTNHYTHTVATLEIDDEHVMARILGPERNVHNVESDWDLLMATVNRAIGQSVTLTCSDDDQQATGRLVAFGKAVVTLDTSLGRVDYPFGLIGEMSLPVGALA